MKFPEQFIAASHEYCTFEKHVNAPLLRREFNLSGPVAEANLLIGAAGFYELYVNGEKISKLLAPYISAPDNIVYYDSYNVREYLQPGENVIGIVLGNGMQNPIGGHVWDFHKAPWRGSPRVALGLTATYTNGETFELSNDENFLTSPSPIYFDDLRCGEYYDVRLEQPGWNMPGFNANNWTPALHVRPPKGEKRICMADPIVTVGQVAPVSVTKTAAGYLYDFGINQSGVCLLHIDGEPGQEIVLEHCEHLLETGELTRHDSFQPRGYTQKDMYICKGEKYETYRPRFTYHGFRYVLVKGLKPHQATENLLTYQVMHSNLAERGGFTCDNQVANTLQELTRRSTLSNFHYFPTDCPHREKNGWTGDAAISAEHTLLNLAPENSYKEWLRSVCKAQNDKGALPGIVPTGGWGFEWGNGPAWDCVLTYLPYFTYIYRGGTEILEENGTGIFRYIHYLSRSMRQDGLIELGLGDWCPPGKQAHEHQAPVLFTDSVISMDICQKAAFIFNVLGWDRERDFAQCLATELRANIRKELIDFATMLALGSCQTSQAMALFYNVFDENENPAAAAQLLHLINETNGHIDTGILGARVIFHVLSDMGQSDLAFNMITRPEYPSYGNWVARGATTLWENFHPQEEGIWSRNHHFFGDISSWFIQRVAGIRYNPCGDGQVFITPSFISSLNFAEAFHITPSGKLCVKWERCKTTGTILLKVSVPDKTRGEIRLEKGWTFEDGATTTPCYQGVHKIRLQEELQ
ncbi:MAG: glycoside hydrolase family 78 protein [Firmicutes bacterium]|nr:glycoside hydrolase family 78 protein [Bacillota bacterium]